MLVNIYSCTPRTSDVEIELKQLYLDVLESAIDFFEPLWTEANNGAPNAGFFDFRKYGNWINDAYATIVTIPGNGMVALAYAVLLTETDKRTFGKAAVPREVVFRHAIQSIRWCCMTSAYVSSPYPYLPGVPDTFAQDMHWIRRPGQRVDATGYLMLAALILWDDLDLDTRRLVEEVAIGSALRGLPPYFWDPVQGGNHDQVKKDLTATLAAAFMFPEHPDHTAFMDTIWQAGIDLVSTSADAYRNDFVSGKPLSSWYRGWNLYDDFSSDHHGHAQIWYGIHDVYEARLMVELFARFTGNPVPETYTYPGNNYEGVLRWTKALFLDSGDLAHPHGAEYDIYYGGACALAFAYGATVLKDPDSAALELLCARLMRRHTQVVQQYDYHRSSWGVAALAYLAHAHIGGINRKVPSISQALATLNGVTYYPRQHCLIHRTPEKWASFSWGTSCRNRGGFAGFIVPQTADPATFAEGRLPLPLIYFHENSLTGTLAVNGAPRDPGSSNSLFQEYDYRNERDDTGFSTAGERIWNKTVAQKQAFFSFEEGPVVILVRLEALADGTVDFTGIPFYFFTRAGLADDHVIMSDQGSGLLESFVGTRTRMRWWCVDNRLGVITVGETPESIIDHMPQVNNADFPPLPPAYNWARKPEYRDTSTRIRIAPLENVRFAHSDTLVDLGLIVHPNVACNEVSRLSHTVNALPFPSGMEGVLFEGQGALRHLAVVNWGDNGAPPAVVRLSFPEGAPVPSTAGNGAISAARTSGSTAEFTIRLGRFDTIRQSFTTYVTVEGGAAIQAFARSDMEIVLHPEDARPVTVIIRHFGSSMSYIVSVKDETGAELMSKTLPADTFARDGCKLTFSREVRVTIVGIRDGNTVD